MKSHTVDSFKKKNYTNVLGDYFSCDAGFITKNHVPDLHVYFKASILLIIECQNAARNDCIKRLGFNNAAC